MNVKQNTPSTRPSSAENQPTQLDQTAVLSETTLLPITLDRRNLQRLAKEVIASLMRYIPQMPAREWNQISEFVLDAVAGASYGTTLNPDRALKITAPFVRWAVLLQGLPQLANSVFTSGNIEQYCLWLAEKNNLEEGSVASYRSVLRKLADALAPAENPEPTRTYARRRIQDPYIRAETNRYRLWANGQHTDAQKRKAKLLLSACAGAGLRPFEIGSIRPADVYVSESGVTITISGSSPRQVTFLAEWEEMFEEAIAGVEPDAFVWGDTTTRTKNKNYVTDFTEHCIGAAPLPSRLRASWLVTLLDRRVHMAIIFEASGFKQFDNLHQYIRFLTRPGNQEARAQLRGGGPE